MPKAPMAGTHTTKVRQRDRGAALIEAALVLPAVIIIILGIVELGFLYRSASVTNSASRSGARLAAAQYAAAQDTATQNTVMDNVRLSVERDLQSRGSTDLPVEMWVYKSDATGTPPSGNFNTCGSNCYVFTWNNGSKHFGSPSGSWPSPDGCGQTLDSVGVFVRVIHAPVGFSAVIGSITVKEKTVMRLEPRTDCTTPE
jgi:hypothetical protein